MIKNLPRAPFLLGILLFLTSFIGLATGHQGASLRAMTYAFWLIAAGTVLYLLDNIRK